MTVREKKAAYAFGAVVGLLGLWQVSEYAAQPFLDVRTTLKSKQTQLNDLQQKVNIARSDLADYARFCALMPEPVEGGPRQNQTERASSYFRDRIYDLIASHPDIAGKFNDLSLGMVKTGSYSLKELRGKEQRQSTLTELSLEVSGSGDMESILRFLVEVYRQNDLIYVTELSFDPVYRGSKKPQTVDFSIGMELLLVQRDADLLEQAQATREAAGDESGAAASTAVEGANDEVDRPDSDGTPEGGAATSGETAAAPGEAGPPGEGAGDGPPGDAPPAESAVTKPGKNEEDLGSRLAFEWKDYQRLLDWRPFDGQDPPPKPPDPTVVEHKSERPERGRPAREEEPEADRDWMVTGCFRGKVDVVLLTRPPENVARAGRGRRRGRGGSGDAEDEPRRVYKLVGEEFDGGILVMVHRQGAVARKKSKPGEPGPDEFWLYPYRKLLTECLLLSEADRYREVQLAMERERPPVEGPEPPPEPKTPGAKDAAGAGKRKQ